MKNKYCSFLFVPATEKLLNKIETCNADAVIIDLEDSIPDYDKCNALKRTTEFLKSYSYNRAIYVRVNPNRFETEISILDDFQINGYMLPKCENIAYIDDVSNLTEKEIIALIESALGVVNVDEIAKHRNVTMLAFGAEDYTSECGIENSDAFLAYPKSKLVLHAKSNKKHVIDTMSINIRDDVSYRVEAEQSKKYGFDAKLAIHPMQVDVINTIFNDDIEYYKKIVSQYEKKGVAVLEIDGRVYEKPHIDATKRKIKELCND
jgi:citrate lyase subunit beta/citryl-CoA lyase